MSSRRRVLLQGLSVAVVLCQAHRSQAQPAFPSKPLRLVVPNAAGGAADLTARTVGQRISENLGQPVVVDNKPGAGGVVAGELVARAAPDGHTLLLISSGTAVSAALFKALPFDTARDFIPVAPLATFDLVIVGPEGGRFRTLGEWVTYAKAQSRPAHHRHAQHRHHAAPGRRTVQGGSRHRRADRAVQRHPRGDQRPARRPDRRRARHPGPLLAQIRAKTLVRWPSPATNARACCPRCRRRRRPG
jgi:hypothetical protein